MNTLYVYQCPICEHVELTTKQGSPLCNQTHLSEEQWFMNQIGTLAMSSSMADMG